MQNTIKKIHGVDDMEVANAISRCFISPCVVDDDGGAANVVDALALVAEALSEIASAIQNLNNHSKQSERVYRQNEEEDSSATE